MNRGRVHPVQVLLGEGEDEGMKERKVGNLTR